MKKLVPITILICLVFSIHCNRSNSNDIEEVVLNPKNEFVNIEFKKEKSLRFTGISYGRLFIYNDKLSENVYVYVYGYDPKKKKKLVTKKYDKDLNFISRKSFPFGQGPGDVGAGTTFCQVGDFIYGPDNTTRRVNIFNKDFNFLKFEKVIEPYISTTFTKNGRHFFGFDMSEDPRGDTFYLIHSTFPGLKKKRIHCIGTFWMFNKQKKLIVGFQPQTSFFIKNERIYFINSADYRLIMFDIKGNMLKKVRLNIKKQKVPENKKKEWLFEQLGNLGIRRCVMGDEIQPASWMIPLEKGFGVIRRKSYSTSCRGMVDADFFDYQLNPLGKIRVPCFYQIFLLRGLRMPDSYYYNDGYFYLIREDEEQEEYYLEKWKVEEKL